MRSRSTCSRPSTVGPRMAKRTTRATCHTLSPYLTPSCQAFLRARLRLPPARRAAQRGAGIDEIPGRGYGDDPTARVRMVSDRDWVVTLDISADGTTAPNRSSAPWCATPSRSRAWTSIPPRNPFGLVLDCYEGTPQRISARSRRARRPVVWLRKRLKEKPHEASCTRAAGLLVVVAAPVRPCGGDPALGTSAAGRAVEVSARSASCSSTRNVRVGVPAGVGERLRVQSAGGAVPARQCADRSQLGCNCRTPTRAR